MLRRLIPVTTVLILSAALVGHCETKEQKPASLWTHRNVPLPVAAESELSNSYISPTGSIPEFGYKDDTDYCWSPPRVSSKAKVLRLSPKGGSEDKSICSMLIDEHGKAYMRLRDSAGLHMFQLTKKDAKAFWGDGKAHDDTLVYLLSGSCAGTIQQFEISLRFENGTCSAYRIKGPGIKSAVWASTGGARKTTAGS